MTKQRMPNTYTGSRICWIIKQSGVAVWMSRRGLMFTEVNNVGNNEYLTSTGAQLHRPHKRQMRTTTHKKPAIVILRSPVLQHKPIKTHPSSKFPHTMTTNSSRARRAALALFVASPHLSATLAYWHTSNMLMRYCDSSQAWVCQVWLSSTMKAAWACRDW